MGALGKKGWDAGARSLCCALWAGCWGSPPQRQDSLQRATRSFHGGNAHEDYPLSSNEKLWVRNQNDPVEARAQLITLRQSIRKLCGCASDDASLLQLLPGSGRLRATQATLSTTG